VFVKDVMKNYLLVKLYKKSLFYKVGYLVKYLDIYLNRIKKQIGKVNVMLYMFDIFQHFLEAKSVWPSPR